MKSTTSRRGARLACAIGSALLTASTLAAAGAERLAVANVDRLSSLALPEAIVADSVGELTLHPSLRNVTGRQNVLVRLSTAPLASGQSSRAAIEAEQAAFINRALAVAPSTEVVASVQLVLNAVALNVDAADLEALAADVSVTRVVGVGDYERNLVDTVPYIGAANAQAAGFSGAGVRVAVIDSGIDYTHADLGGPGTRAAYETAWAPLPAPGAPAIPVVAPGTGYTAVPAGLFPNAKVIGGYDFVGETWPSGPLTPDANPVSAPDASTFGGHGTHVAAIIAGNGGVAPGAKLFAVKACSAPATSCSGVALIQAMEFSVDPNGDGDTSDRMDIINMSLGANYGQAFDDDLAAAVDNATALGAMTVASAGNGADKQFITGTPAAATTALSVAQTEMPRATVNTFSVLAPVTSTLAAVFQPWSAPLASAIEGPVVYPAAGAKRLGCSDAAGANPYTAGELAGRIVIVDRGVCGVSFKIANLASAGAILGIVGFVDGTAPFAFAYAGGNASIPGFAINQTDANILRAGNAVVRFEPSGVLPLAASMRVSSSRGPRMDDNLLKPEIGAPGQSVSASSATFTGRTGFGGTSGAAPMVAGAAAILKAARPELSIGDIKQILINTANPNVAQVSAANSVLPDQPAPISRIGGGEVRVDRALVSPAFVSDVTGDEASALRGGISLGYLDVDRPVQTYARTLRVTNKSNRSQRYAITPTFRFADDVATDAVSVTVSPRNLTVPAGGSAQVRVRFQIKGQSLRDNQMNAGSLGGSIGPLTLMEYDGYVVFQGRDHQLTMPWHVLPRKAANVVTNSGPYPLYFDDSGLANTGFYNMGVGTAQLQAFSLVGLSPNAPRGGKGEGAPNPDMRAVGVNTFLAPAGLCGPTQNFVWEFAFNLWERNSTPAGQFLEIDLDVNRDGFDDYVIINRDVSGLTTFGDGRQVTAVLRLNPATGAIVSQTLRFFVENATNTGTSVLRVCGSDLGLTLADAGTRLIDTNFFTLSWSQGGATDRIGTVTLTPGGEQFLTTLDSASVAFETFVPAQVQAFAPIPGTTTELGAMVVTSSDFGPANRGGATQATETILMPRPGVDLVPNFVFPEN